MKDKVETVVASQSIDEFMAELDKHRDELLAMHPVKRFFVQFPKNLVWKYKDLKFQTRVKFNRMVHGYDECDWWEYASCNSERAVKLLTMLRDKGHGFKCMQPENEGHDCWEGTCAKLWKETLNDMIYFHQICAGDSIIRMDLKGEDLERFEAGRAAYFREYESLWD